MTPEEQINQLKAQLASAQQEIELLLKKSEDSAKQITKWKFKFNSKNADYILLQAEHEKLKAHKTSPFNSFWFYLLLALLALAFWPLTHL